MSLPGVGVIVSIIVAVIFALCLSLSLSSIHRYHLRLFIEHITARTHSLEKKSTTTTHTRVPSINSLPPEILGEIFILVAIRNCSGPPSCSWVCSYWRSVALGYPRLWGHSIDVKRDCEDWVMEKLRRGSATPPHLHLSLASNEIFVEIALRNSVNIISSGISLRCIALSVPIHILCDITSRFPPVAEHVETIELRARGTGIAKLPRSALAMNTPMLRKLLLARCSFQWNLLQSRNLVDLCLFSVPATSQPHLLFILVGSPNLQKLVIHGSLPRNYASVKPVVTLNRLSYLELSGNILECAALLVRIRYPVTAQTHLLKCGLRESLDHLTNAVAAIKIKFRATHQPYLRIELRKSGIHFSGWFRTNNAWKKITSLHLISHPTPEILVPTLCGAFPTRSILVLGIDVQPQTIIEGELWSEILSFFNATQRLHLFYRPPASLIDFLLLDAQQHNTTLLPALKLVTMSSLSLNTLRSDQLSVLVYMHLRGLLGYTQ
ncbi:hypothetical protein BJ138DRAFT_1115068 [Hygrophoropsis aurantiaca]|uniref:Uncharacterized protein n=1 Tax=Hygrophoropsis aurantiaca TaxID=72124 RepID=A0ACB8A8D6_9AGAM|nr:hypothetical protein BJ138DRAFT_1115068 [Hygrophoropsis aurantiaca]